MRRKIASQSGGSVAAVATLSERLGIGPAIYLGKIDADAFNLSIQGAFVHIEFLGSGRAIVLVAFKSLQDHSGLC